MKYLKLVVLAVAIVVIWRGCFTTDDVDEDVLRTLAHHFPNNRLEIDTSGPTFKRHYTYLVHDVIRGGRSDTMQCDIYHFGMVQALAWIPRDTSFHDSLRSYYDSRYGAPKLDYSWSGSDTFYHYVWQTDFGHVQLRPDVPIPSFSEWYRVIE